jgi:hypothetical protein
MPNLQCMHESREFRGAVCAAITTAIALAETRRRTIPPELAICRRKRSEM